MIEFECPNCRMMMAVPESLVGQSQRCPSCGNVALEIWPVSGNRAKISGASCATSIPKPIRISCPICASRLVVPYDERHNAIACPNCRKTIQLAGHQLFWAGLKVRCSELPAGFVRALQWLRKRGGQVIMAAYKASQRAAQEYARGRQERIASLPVPPPMQSAPIVPQLATAQPAHVTVNVNGPKATSGLGIAALVLGILACLTCWIPLIGLLSIPFSVLGILFGIIGFVVSGVGRRSGIGMPVAGMVICVVTLVIAVAATDVVLRPTAWLLTAAQAKLNLAETQIATLGHQLELYNLNIGHYPTDDEGGLKALLVKPNFSDPTMGTNWSGPYINQDQLKDPWGHPMHYRVTQPGTPEALQVPFKLWSTGPDGEADTSSPDKVAATMLLPTKTKLAPTVPPQAPPREPCSLTYASYMRLQCGMTAQQVASILGNNYSGQEVSRSYMPGIPEVSGPVETVMFELQGDHGNATLIFQNAILVQKSQFGLQ